MKRPASIAMLGQHTRGAMMRFGVRLLVLALVLVARGAFAGPISVDSAFAVRYASDLLIGESFVDFRIPVASPDPTPVMPADIVDWSVSATGGVAFEMSATNGSPTVTCGVACFDVSPTGLSMHPGYFATFSENQGEGMVPTMSLTMTNDPTIIRGTWFNAFAPGVVATATGPISAVPEPATVTLVGLGVLGLGRCRLRRR